MGRERAISEVLAAVVVLCRNARRESFVSLTVELLEKAAGNGALAAESSQLGARQTTSFSGLFLLFFFAKYFLGMNDPKQGDRHWNGA